MTAAERLRKVAEELMRISEQTETVEIHADSGAVFYDGGDGWERHDLNGTYTFIIEINGGARNDWIGGKDS